MYETIVYLSIGDFKSACELARSSVSSGHQHYVVEWLQCKHLFIYIQAAQVG